MHDRRLPSGARSWYRAAMESVPAKKSALMTIMLAILLAPLAIAFIIAASLAGGPSEVFKALTGRE